MSTWPSLRAHCIPSGVRGWNPVDKKPGGPLAYRLCRRVGVGHSCGPVSPAWRWCIVNLRPTPATILGWRMCCLPQIATAR